VFSIILLFEISYSFDATNIIYIFQNWGDYTDMSQAVILYVSYAGDVVLICWFGTKLTQHVRQYGIFVIVADVYDIYVHNVYAELNQLRGYDPI